MLSRGASRRDGKGKVRVKRGKAEHGKSGGAYEGKQRFAFRVCMCSHILGKQQPLRMMNSPWVSERRFFIF
jgi:hypothetical protein